MTDRIDGAIAASLERILDDWCPRLGEDSGVVVARLHVAIKDEIDWLRR